MGTPLLTYFLLPCKLTCFGTGLLIDNAIKVPSFNQSLTWDKIAYKNAMYDCMMQVCQKLGY